MIRSSMNGTNEPLIQFPIHQITSNHITKASQQKKKQYSRISPPLSLLLSQTYIYIIIILILIYISPPFNSQIMLIPRFHSSFIHSSLPSFFLPPIFKHHSKINQHTNHKKCILLSFNIQYCISISLSVSISVSTLYIDTIPHSLSTHILHYN